MANFFSFPNPVNERAARTVAAGVVTLGVLTLITQWPPLLIVLAAGFVGRVLAGPRLSPLGFIAQRVIAPRLGPAHLVPGPPKRFAQGIGATLTLGALVSFYVADAAVLAWVLVAAVVIAAAFEAAFGFCLGCAIFGRLQAVGLIPKSVCEACNDVRFRRSEAVAPLQTSLFASPPAE